MIPSPLISIFTVSKKGQYSQKGQRVQHCHQHREHQRGQQGHHDLSHQEDHDFPKGRIHKKNRSDEKSVCTAVIQCGFEDSWWMTTKGKQEFYWGLLRLLRFCAWMVNLEIDQKLTASPGLPAAPWAPDSPYGRHRRRWLGIWSVVTQSHRLTGQIKKLNCDKFVKYVYPCRNYNTLSSSSMAK